MHHTMCCICWHIPVKTVTLRRPKRRKMTKKKKKKIWMMPIMTRSDCDYYRHCEKPVLFCSLAVLDPTVGRTIDIISLFISVLCHSDWLFNREFCPRLDVVHPGCVWSSSPACTCHCSLHDTSICAAREVTGWLSVSFVWSSFKLYMSICVC